MTKSTINSRREHFIKQRDTEKLSDVPVELPAGARIPAKSMEQQIQEQIAIQIAKKQIGVEQTPDEIFAELEDLEPDDPEPPWTSQYEVQELPSEPFEVEPFIPPDAGGATPEGSAEEQKEVDAETET